MNQQLENNFLFFSVNHDGTYTFLGRKFKKKPFFHLGKRSLLGLLLIFPTRFFDTPDTAQSIIELTGKFGYDLLMGGLLLIFVILCYLDGRDYYYRIP